MKAVLLLGLVACSAAVPAEVRSLFDEWKKVNGKAYATAEEHELRLQHFHRNHGEVARLSAAEAVHRHGATFKLNKFADWSAEELRRLRGIRGMHAGIRAAAPVGAVPNITADAVDWRTKNVLAPVQDQGQCGSCWAFSATATLEAQAAIASQSAPQKLSEQWLVDCDHQCGTYREENGCDSGCDGGLQPNAWVYTNANGGQPSESAYPYQAVAGTCQTGNPGITKPRSWEFAPQDEPSIARYIAANGPVSVAVNAAQWSFYSGGIMSSSSICPATSTPWDTLDHGVNIVGFGTEGTTDFWIIRNSWNSDWGENGYCRILRGSNFCGINLFVCRALM